MPLEQPYPYPVTNSELIKAHSLEKHFEGGFFRQTVALSSYSANGSTSTGDGSRRPQEYFGPGTTLLGGTLEQVKSDGSKKDEKLDATLIHYLLTPESYQGKMHMNLNAVSPELID
jgi:predicted cupin superfamily sugar epimerase